jgi:hypothetical protein
MTRLVRCRGTPGWLALYALGLLCVVFFVLFEVLDVDGSEFDHVPSRLSIKLAEAGHDDDIRRISLRGGGLAPTLVVTIVTTVLSPTITRRLGRARHVSLPRTRISRAALARALLSDVPPSV